MADGHLHPDQFLKRKLFLWGSLEQTICWGGHVSEQPYAALLVFRNDP